MLINLGERAAAELERSEGVREDKERRGKLGFIEEVRVRAVVEAEGEFGGRS